jgi:hypothetical protein
MRTSAWTVAGPQMPRAELLGNEELRSRRGEVAYTAHWPRATRLRDLECRREPVAGAGGRVAARRPASVVSPRAFQQVLCGCDEVLILLSRWQGLGNEKGRNQVRVRPKPAHV